MGHCQSVSDINNTTNEYTLVHQHLLAR